MLNYTRDPYVYCYNTPKNDNSSYHSGIINSLVLFDYGSPLGAIIPFPTQGSLA